MILSCDFSRRDVARPRRPRSPFPAYPAYTVPVLTFEDALHVDQEHDPTLMLERAVNGARSCNHSSKPGAIVHRVGQGQYSCTGVCQRDSYT
eukprot:7381432-Prymnesium_polylepis.1